MENRWLIGGNRLPLAAEKNVDVPMVMAEYGLSAYEIAGGHGFNMTPPNVRSIRHNSEDCGVSITIHGMYAASLMSKPKVNYTRLFHYLNDGMYYGEELGGGAVVFHPGGRTEKNVETQLINTINVLIHTLSFSKFDPSLIYLETMDGSLFGTFSELMKISEVVGTRICVDWTHLWARAQHGNRPFGKKEIRGILRELEGTDWRYEQYFHMSGATISSKGEAEHCDLEASRFPYRMVLDEVMSSKLGGRIIVESGADHCTDALLVQEYLTVS
jgi:deoxyribonuclease-4